jgi:threonine synthase
MLASGGRPLVVGEHTLARANALALEKTGIRVDATGSSGLAGLLALRASGDVADDERVAILFTGVIRKEAFDREEMRDEKLPRAGHPVPEGFRAD